jgi:hypothetical protein
MTDDRENRIRDRAFDLWQQEGSLDGRSLGHWLQAEKEVDEEKDEAVSEDEPNPVNLSEYRKGVPN